MEGLCGSCWFQMGGLRPYPQPFFWPSAPVVTRKHHVITMFAVRRACADHFVCKRAGCAPPTSPFYFERPSMFSIVVHAVGSSCSLFFTMSGFMMFYHLSAVPVNFIIFISNSPVAIVLHHFRHIPIIRMLPSYFIISTISYLIVFLISIAFHHCP